MKAINNAVNEAQSLSYLSRTWHALDTQNVLVQTAWKVALVVTASFLLLKAMDLAKNWLYPRQEPIDAELEVQEEPAVIIDMAQLASEITDVLAQKLQENEQRLPPQPRMHAYRQVILARDFESIQEFEAFQGILFEKMFKDEQLNRGFERNFCGLIVPALFDAYLEIPSVISPLIRINQFYDSICLAVGEKVSPETFQHMKTEKILEAYPEELQRIPPVFSESGSSQEILAQLPRISTNLQILQSLNMQEQLEEMQTAVETNFCKCVTDRALADQLELTNEVLDQVLSLSLFVNRSSIVVCIVLINLHRFMRNENIPIAVFVGLLEYTFASINAVKENLDENPYREDLLNFMRLKMADLVRFAKENCLPFNFSVQGAAQQRNRIRDLLSNEPGGIPGLIGMGTIDFQIRMMVDQDEQVAQQAQFEEVARNLNVDAAVARALDRQLNGRQ